MCNKDSVGTWIAFRNNYTETVVVINEVAEYNSKLIWRKCRYPTKKKKIRGKKQQQWKMMGFHIRILRFSALVYIQRIFPNVFNENGVIFECYNGNGAMFVSIKNAVNQSVIMGMTRMRKLTKMTRMTRTTRTTKMME